MFVVYASFIQRSIDELLHDICFQDLPVLILIDHAGFVSGDGRTHQGVYDLGMLRALPGLTVWAPCDACELADMIRLSGAIKTPRVIRYPKALPAKIGEGGFALRWRSLCPGEDTVIISHGQAVPKALETAKRLKETGVSCAVYNASLLKPLDLQTVKELTSQYALLTVIEEEQSQTGLGAALATEIARMEKAPRLLIFGVPDIKPQAHSLKGLMLECGMETERIAAAIKGALHGQEIKN